MMHQARVGELYMMAAAALWGLLPVISKQAYQHIPILMCAALSAFVTAIFFAVLLTLRGEWRDLLCKTALASSLISGVGIGVLFYGLVFWGQSMVPASTTSVLLLMEVFYSMLLLRVLGHERLTRRQVVGAGVMVAGAIIVLAPNSASFLGLGELILLFAAIIPPIANYHMQRARKYVGASSILFLRSCISLTVICLLALWLEPLPSTSDLLAAAPWILINGILIFGVSKIFWVEAIRRIPISKAVAMNSLAPLVTLAVAYWLLGEPAAWYQWVGCAPLTLGCWILVSNRSTKRTHQTSTPAAIE
ncbi:DMT family transporter [Marinobacterium lutimaris]|uniref:Permease of the drug/metabolite transporter (DMT) superfamily n=1 Tax=Marinobacterium lutimaris TaxID=568106 RepID=A0A1H5TM75_9GAMM|nr:DMT family transporter [Marinobacterium lutimaris]SEF63308.1 Permease of the drug/metabolite transporter (DMT) superfamily [Marinobacterium lutimaris]